MDMNFDNTVEKEGTNEKFEVEPFISSKVECNYLFSFVARSFLFYITHIIV